MYKWLTPISFIEMLFFISALPNYFLKPSKNYLLRNWPCNAYAIFTAYVNRVRRRRPQFEVY